MAAQAWGFVGIPLAWGVIQTAVHALKLFQSVPGGNP